MMSSSYMHGKAEESVPAIIANTTFQSTYSHIDISAKEANTNYLTDDFKGKNYWCLCENEINKNQLFSVKNSNQLKLHILHKYSSI